MWLLGVAITGLLLLLDVTDFVNVPEEDDGYNDGEFLAVAPWRYVTGIVLEFCGLQASQSVVLVSHFSTMTIVYNCIPISVIIYTIFFLVVNVKQSSTTKLGKGNF